MEIRRSKHGLVVGIFTALALAIFIVTIFTLGGEQKSFTKKFPVKVVFPEINGLKQGNNVWFSGVKIGTVKSIVLKGASNVEVTLNIETKSQPFIKQDAMAKIGSEGFLGNKIVIIYAGSSTAACTERYNYK
jgi:phospholipid/cholesterol/gamma-HCH transport system substrate-binding protein